MQKKPQELEAEFGWGLSHPGKPSMRHECFGTQTIVSMAHSLPWLLHWMVLAQQWWNYERGFRFLSIQLSRLMFSIRLMRH